uniref:hypothetical protein n=1 Tax=Escherichia coli TaxID=562 RepID=UPI001BC89F92
MAGVEKNFFILKKNKLIRRIKKNQTGVGPFGEKKKTSVVGGNRGRKQKTHAFISRRTKKL